MSTKTVKESRNRLKEYREAVQSVVNGAADLAEAYFVFGAMFRLKNPDDYIVIINYDSDDYGTVRFISLANHGSGHYEDIMTTDPEELLDPEREITPIQIPIGSTGSPVIDKVPIPDEITDVPLIGDSAYWESNDRMVEITDRFVNYAGNRLYRVKAFWDNEGSSEHLVKEEDLS